MNKKTLTIVAVTALIAIILAPRLKTLPLLNKLPTV